MLHRILCHIFISSHSIPTHIIYKHLVSRATSQYKDSPSRYGYCHFKDKTVVPSYRWHGNPYTVKTTSLYWDGPWMTTSGHKNTFSKEWIQRILWLSGHDQIPSHPLTHDSWLSWHHKLHSIMQNILLHGRSCFIIIRILKIFYHQAKPQCHNREQYVMSYIRLIPKE